MNFQAAAFIDWNIVPAESTPGERGSAQSKTAKTGGLKIRMVTYSAGYIADHWCTSGHFIHCLSGSASILFQKNLPLEVNATQTFLLCDDPQNGHCVTSENGCTFLILD